MVVNPADVPTKHKEKTGKADKVDCRKLARTLRSGDIKGIYTPSRTEVEERHLIRTRQSMVRKQTRCKNQIKAILFFYGIPFPEEGTLVQELHQPDRSYPHGKSQRRSCPQSPS